MPGPATGDEGARGVDDAALDDPDLLGGVRRRDPEALGRFFDRAFPFVHGIAARLCRNTVDAEDVTQDALHRIYLAADRLDPARSARPWLAVITANVLRDHPRRRWGRREHAFDPSVLAARASAAERPENGLVRRERRRLLERAIEALDEDHRAVLVLRVRSGCSYEEIAGALGIRPSAARKRYSRALGKVKEFVRRQEP
jgi:RNA polymerase sigma-70 factor (ECF subfamily)